MIYELSSHLLLVIRCWEHSDEWKLRSFKRYKTTVTRTAKINARIAM